MQTSLYQWRIVFGVTSVVATFTYLMFQIYGTAKIQDWNYPSKSRNLLLGANEIHPQQNGTNGIKANNELISKAPQNDNRIHDEMNDEEAEEDARTSLMSENHAPINK